MNPASLLELLSQIKDGKLTPEEGVARLSKLEYEDIGFAKIDHHRTLRTGMPEVIYAAGKTDAQVLEIFSRMAETSWPRGPPPRPPRRCVPKFPGRFITRRRDAFRCARRKRRNFPGPSPSCARGRAIFPSARRRA